MIIKGYLLIFSYIGLLLLLTYILNHEFKVKVIYSRKLVHIMVTFIWPLMIHFFGFSWHLMVGPLLFVIINYISYKKKFFKAIENESSGTVYYALSILIMSIITFLHPKFFLAFGVGFYCLGFADGLAPLVANYLKSKEIINNKTISGTLTVFFVSLLVVIFFNHYLLLNFKIFKVLIVAMASAILELFGKDGWDNLTLPLGVSTITYLLGDL